MYELPSQYSLQGMASQTPLTMQQLSGISGHPAISYTSPLDLQNAKLQTMWSLASEVKCNSASQLISLDTVNSKEHQAEISLPILRICVHL